MNTAGEDRSLGEGGGFTGGAAGEDRETASRQSCRMDGGALLEEVLQVQEQQTQKA